MEIVLIWYIPGNRVGPVAPAVGQVAFLSSDRGGPSRNSRVLFCAPLWRCGWKLLLSNGSSSSSSFAGDLVLLQSAACRSIFFNEPFQHYAVNAGLFAHRWRYSSGGGGCSFLLFFCSSSSVVDQSICYSNEAA